MKKLRNQHILGRARDFLSAWHNIAPAAKFGGTSVDELEQKTREAEQIRQEIFAAETRLSGLRLKRDQTERALADELIRLAYGVRGHPDYGGDSPFYRALGFVPNSENRSGRPRKRKE
jgi:hypothetical protein